MTAYYTATGNPPAATKGLSALLRAEFLLIQTAFATMGVPGSSALGAPFKWSTSTAASDPGAGYLRLNNATFASATAAYIDLTNSNGSDVTAMLDLMGTSTNPTKALLRLTKLSDTTKWLLFSVTALASPGGYKTATIAYVSGTATFAADDDIQLEIAIVGDKGNTGAAGTNGVNATTSPAYGDGSDGNVTISAGTTTLTRNTYYNNLTINGTGSLDPAGYQVFVAGTLDLTAAPAGAIKRTPIVGGNAAAGAGGTAPTAMAKLSRADRDKDSSVRVRRLSLPLRRSRHR